MAASYFDRGMTGDATFSLYIRPTPERPWFVAHGVDRVLAFLDDSATETTSSRICAASVSASRHSSELRAARAARRDLGGARRHRRSGRRADPRGAPAPSRRAAVETAVINLVQLSDARRNEGRADRCSAAQGRPLVDFGFRRAHGLETGSRRVTRGVPRRCRHPRPTSKPARRYGIPSSGRWRTHSSRLPQTSRRFPRVRRRTIRTTRSCSSTPTTLNEACATRSSSAHELRRARARVARHPSRLGRPDGARESRSTDPGRNGPPRRDDLRVRRLGRE